MRAGENICRTSSRPAGQNYNRDAACNGVPGVLLSCAPDSSDTRRETRSASALIQLRHIQCDFLPSDGIRFQVLHKQMQIVQTGYEKEDALVLGAAAKRNAHRCNGKRA